MIIEMSYDKEEKTDMYTFKLKVISENINENGEPVIMKRGFRCKLTEEILRYGLPAIPENGEYPLLILPALKFEKE